ncbi:hypothetical protein [Spirosoma luteolum]
MYIEPDYGVLYQHQDLVLTVTKQPDSACVSLLKRAEYGTNGVRYQQTGQEAKINQLAHPLFFQLYRDTALVGMYCLDERTIDGPTGPIRGFYGRYLVVDHSEAGQGYGHLLKRQAVQFVEKVCPEPFVYYSYIEARNARSMRISGQEGFTSIGTLKTYIFRRYEPTLAPGFAVLSEADRTGLLAQLETSYRRHNLTTFHGIGYEGNYFVLKEQGIVVAGIQANPVHWRFLNMPGVGGWLTMHLAPLLSVTRRFFDPTNYAFVALEGLYLKRPSSTLLTTLLESVLAHFGFHSALWLLDASDPVHELVNQPGKGWLSGYQQDVITHVMIKPVGIAIDAFRAGQPVYVSSFDYT